MRGTGGKRWGVLGLAATVSLLLVATLVQSAGSAASAEEADNAITVHGWPNGQAGLTVWRSNCTDGDVADDNWAFQTVATSTPFGPSAVGWRPTGTGGVYGVEAPVDHVAGTNAFQIDLLTPEGASEGYGQVHYFPAGGAEWYGYTADFTTTGPGWHTVNVSQMPFDWFRVSGDTVLEEVAGVTIGSFTAQHGDGPGGLSMFFGCDGNDFYIDGFKVGSTATGVDTYNFEDFITPSVSLSQVGGAINTCHLSAGQFPQKVSFRGRTNPGGPWEGQQYVGRRKGHWRVVARGSTSGQFRYTAKLFENSYFDAVRPWTDTTRYVDSSPDRYVPAFPVIKVRASSTTVRQGKSLVFTGSIKPARGKVSYTVLRAEANGRKWTRFQSLGTHKTDRKGNFRFTVKAKRPGWARINILTKTERDLTSALNPRAVLYEVLKPKKKKHKVTPVNQPSDPGDNNAEQPDPIPTPAPDPPPPFVPRIAGYGNCGWFPTGGPPKGRILPGQRALLEQAGGALAARPDGEPLPTEFEMGGRPAAPGVAPAPAAHPRPAGAR